MRVEPWSVHDHALSMIENLTFEQNQTGTMDTSNMCTATSASVAAKPTEPFGSVAWTVRGTVLVALITKGAAGDRRAKASADFEFGSPAGLNPVHSSWSELSPVDKTLILKEGVPALPAPGRLKVHVCPSIPHLFLLRRFQASPERRQTDGQTARQTTPQTARELPRPPENARTVTRS